MGADTSPVAVAFTVYCGTSYWQHRQKKKAERQKNQNTIPGGSAPLKLRTLEEGSKSFDRSEVVGSG
jgi:hypothetical protein